MASRSVEGHDGRLRICARGYAATMAPLFDSNRRIADALGVPAWLLTGMAWIGFAFLAVGGMAQIPAFGVVAALFGVALGVIGVRGLFAPSQRVELGTPGMDRLFGTSRRVGAFYILVAVIWIGLSVGVVLGD